MKIPLTMFFAGILTFALSSTTPAQVSTPPDTSKVDTMKADTTKAEMTSEPMQIESAEESKIYYGGYIGLNLFGDVFRISIQPMLAYKLTPKLHIGGKIGYEYVSSDAGNQTFTAHNYGASVFTRFRLIPQIYAHAEFTEINFDYPGGREWVPFLLLGGGFSQPIGGRTWATAEILWDVLQDSRSPYDTSEPWVSIGVGVGF